MNPGRSLPDQLPLILIDATASLSGGAVYLINLLRCWVRVPPPYRFVVLHTKDLDLTGIGDGGDWMTFREVVFPPILSRNQLLGSVMKMIWRLFILPFHLRRYRPAVFFSNSGTVPRLVPRGVRPVIAIHNAMPFHPELWPVERSWPRRLRLIILHRQSVATLRSGVECIVFSNDLKRRVLRMGGSTARCAVVHHGIEWGAAERLGLREIREEWMDSPYLLYVSQLHRYKNVERLLEAFSLLHREYPEIKLLIVGHVTDRTYAIEIEAGINNRGLDGVVRIVPGMERKRLLDFYRGALGIVYPSLIENCPFGLLESMAMGKPIAAARIGAIEEICAGAAIYFDPTDPAEMALRMSEMVGNEELRSELATRAIARAASFTWASTSDRTLEVLAQGTGEPPVVNG
jgi:glycosyltransferase involved in cell wall biosynthesis